MQNQTFDQKTYCLHSQDGDYDWDRDDDERKERGAVDEKAGATRVDRDADHGVAFGAGDMGGDEFVGRVVVAKIPGETAPEHPDLPVLVLSMHDEAIYAERALRARANGYIMKQEAAEKVLVAIRRILNGEVYLSYHISSKMLQQYISGAPSMIQSRISSLSDRELEVFRLIGEGRATREIADELHLSVKTVETYQAHIKEKLALRSGRELIQHAIQWKIHEKSA